MKCNFCVCEITFMNELRADFDNQDILLSNENGNRVDATTCSNLGSSVLQTLLIYITISRMNDSGLYLLWSFISCLLSTYLCCIKRPLFSFHNILISKAWKCIFLIFWHFLSLAGSSVYNIWKWINFLLNTCIILNMLQIFTSLVKSVASFLWAHLANSLNILLSGVQRLIS